MGAGNKGTVVKGPLRDLTVDPTQTQMETAYRGTFLVPLQLEIVSSGR